MQTTETSKRNWIWQGARALCLVVFTVGLVRTAWVAEDAFITFRTVDNFFNGFGLRWNPAERVQTYSHPLWMMLLSVGRSISGEYYFSSLSLAVLFTAITLYWTGFRSGGAVAGGVCALLILALSKAFVEYSTSGLEAPLTHCLIALFAGQLFLNGDKKSRLFRMACIASLAAVNRIDTLALFGPALLLACHGVGFRRSLRTLIVGFLPLFAWTGFATLYYGTPIPVTGFAKAMTGLPQGELFAQGVLFFKDALVRDPITLPAMVLGLGLALRKGAAEMALALGALLYCAYLLKIGGGYMAGRFLTPPLLVATILIARSVAPATRVWKPAALIATSVALGLMCKTAPLLSGSDFNARAIPVPESGIVDERGQWYPRTGLLSESRDIPSPNGLEAMLGVDFDPKHPQIFVDGKVGLDGFLGGPGVHFVDPMLCDPLLMRLPIWDAEDWQVGHFMRGIPDGYLLSLALGKNMIRHPGLAKGYDDLRLVLRGDLLDADRLRAIWSLAVGSGAKGIREFASGSYRKPELVEVQQSDLVKNVEANTSIWNESFHQIGAGGVLIRLTAEAKSAEVEFMVGGLAEYSIGFRKGEQSVGSVTQSAGGATKLFPGAQPMTVPVPQEAIESGFDGILLKPKGFRRTGVHSLASMRLQD